MWANVFVVLSSFQRNWKVSKMFSKIFEMQAVEKLQDRPKR